MYRSALFRPSQRCIPLIYAFQKADGTLKQILIASPNLTNGIIKEDWVHGSELASEGYWPYTLYQYDAAAGSFQELAQVNMWSKAVDTVDLKGDPYPDDIDAEGAGTVFILGQADEVKTVSKSDYEKVACRYHGRPRPAGHPLSGAQRGKYRSTELRERSYEANREAKKGSVYE